MLRLDRALTLASTGWGYGYGAGAHVTVTKDAWYLFGRKLAPSPPAFFQAFETLTLGVQVRRSTDRGATWSDAVEILGTKDGTPQECAATDGDAYFEEATATWHYLYQCEDRTGIWKGCHRGIAKTTDFHTFVAGDPARGVPSDAIHDRDDAVPWREAWQTTGPIGGGAGSILFDSGFYYSIVETGDLTLGCVDGQNWDWGMSRSATLSASAWEQLPAGNPFLYSSKVLERGGKSIACNPAYSRLFRDTDGAVHLHTTRESNDPAHSGIFLYTLVASANLLDNGDLWKCQTAPWTVLALGPTNLVVYRSPAGSSDEGCYLATNCGAATCLPGQSVYQDVAISGAGGRALRFGGKFATDSGTGAMDLAVIELDASSAIVASHTVTVNATGTYALAGGSGTLDAKTTRLRYQLYLNAPATFRADEMFLEAR